MLVGLRGRKVDNHPVCRRCGFDLFGSSQSVVCPECGGDLNHRKAITLGHRVRRRKPLAVGIVLLLPAVAVLAALGVVAARGIDLDRHKPLWLLMRENDAKSLAELNRRLSAGELASEQVQHIIARGLAIQADPSRKWVSGWGDFIERGRGMGLVDDAQWDAYAKQAVAFQLQARPRVRRGDAIVIRITPAVGRAASPSSLGLSWQVTSVRVGDVPCVRLVPPGEFSRPTSMFDDRSELRTDRFVPDLLVNDLALGLHPVHVDLVAAVRGGWTPPRSVLHPVRLQARVEIVSRDEPVVRLVRDPSLGRALEATLRREAYVGVTPEGATGLYLSATQPPVGIAGTLALRDGRGRQWSYGQVNFPSREFTLWTGAKRFDGFDAERVDIVLRSSASAASAESIDIAEIWDGEIVIQDVPVAWAPGVSRPTKGTE